MKRLQQQKIDDFFKEIETLNDLRYRINKERDYCNHAFVIKELLPEYRAVTENCKHTLKKLLDDNIEE